jgi:hypothetical protein
MTQPVYIPRPIKRRRRTKTEIERIREAIYDVLKDDYPMTVRGVFYQLVKGHVVPKLESECKQTVGRLLLQMRRNGIVPYDWISDNIRWMRKPRTWSSMESAARHTAQTYRRDLWANQHAYVEIWVEKDALAGVILEETEPWDVPLMVSRGFASESYLYECAQHIKAIKKPAYLYYFGDHDPSGVRIDPAIRRHLERMAPTSEIHFERVAVLPEQIEEFDLPTRPTKTGGTHAKGFAGESVDLDAIAAGTIRQMVKDKIESHVNWFSYRLTKFAEESERNLLQQWAEQISSGDEKAEGCLE